MKQPKKAISLFAGIEGFGLAIHKMGWEVIASVEWEQFPQMVIKKNFPKTEIHGDIKEFDGRKFRGTIDIICGGFPCQPYSLAGKRRGKDDDRHLWPEMLRVIREVQPAWVIGENVPGLVNWSKGVVFEEVQSDLEAQGYEVQSFILPAAGVGAPHRRDRVWIVAYSDHPRASVKMRNNGRGEKDDQRWERFSRPEYRQNGSDGAIPHSHGSGFQETRTEQQAAGVTGSCSQRNATHPSDTRLQRGKKFGGITRERQESYKQPAGRICTDWQNFPTQSPVCDGDDGIPTDLVRYILRTGGDCYTEEEAEKEAKKIISKVRAEGIKAGGNAIVHQVALQIFKSIKEFENTTKCKH